MKEYLRIEFDRTDRTYRAGETVKGKVLVGAPRGDQCKAIHLTRLWRTHGKGNVDKGEPTVTRLHTGPLSVEDLHEFEFEFPAPPGPFTYHGHYLNVDQYVEVQLDLPWTRDPKRSEEYVLLPGTPVAPPPSLLDFSENPMEKAVPGCSAFIGSVAVVVGLIMVASADAMGIFALLAALVFFVPWLKTLGEKKLGNAKAYLTSLVVEPGGEGGVEVRVSPKKPLRMNGAVVELRAREVCVAGSGSNRRTLKHTVFSRTLPLSGAMTLEGGQVRLFPGSFQIPDGAPASFKGAANKLLWEARVQLDIPSWPDWEKKIPLVVWPQRNLLKSGEVVEILPQPEEPVPVVETPDAWGEPLRPKPETHVAELPPWLANIELPVPTPLLNLSEIDPEPEAGPEPGPGAGPEPEPEAGPEPVEAELESDSTDLPDEVRAIVDAKIFGGEKDLLIKSMIGKPYEFTLEVKRVDRSFGIFSDSQYRNGHTITGSVLGSGLEVAVFFPEERNDEVKGWEQGSLHTVRGEVKDWDRLRKRPEFIARG